MIARSPHEGKSGMGILGLVSTTVRKGQITETKILARLTELGYNCLIPWGNDRRYDIAIDNEGQLLRLQCKTGRYNEKKGIIEFNTAITDHARGERGSHVRRGYVGQADYFGIYCPELGTLYLVPVEDAPKGIASLRVRPTKNGQVKGVLMAETYLL
jgi:PD-(D/E)XK endonuclease